VRPTDVIEGSDLPPPDFSVVIPLYNEENILETAIFSLLARLDFLNCPFEVILAENGSRDKTAEMVDSLARREPNIKALHSDRPDYGHALKLGILAARGKYIICDEIDLCDVDFYRRALDLLDGDVDLVIGSKRHPQSSDRRPWLRRQGTSVINGMLRLCVGFKGSDTHGLKAFKRQPMLKVVQSCQLSKDLFASELVIRAQHQGLSIEEIPLTLREIRPPSIHLFKRVPRVLLDIAKLTYCLRINK